MKNRWNHDIWSKISKIWGVRKIFVFARFFFILQKFSSEKFSSLIDAEMYKLSIAGIFRSFRDLWAKFWGFRFSFFFAKKKENMFGLALPFKGRARPMPQSLFFYPKKKLSVFFLPRPQEILKNMKKSY